MSVGTSIAIPAGVELENVREGSTAHDPILLSLGGRRPPDESATVVKRHTDWELFCATMQRHGGTLLVIETTDKIEAAVTSLEADIHAALGTSTTETVTRRLANPRRKLPPEVRQLLRERRGAKRRAIRTRLPQDKQAANQLNRRVKTALDEHVQERWRLHLESLNPQDNTLWKAKKATGNTHHAMAPIHGENGVVYRKQEKAEAMVDSLELQCRENYLPNEDEEHTDQVERRIRRLRREPEQRHTPARDARRNKGNPAETNPPQSRRIRQDRKQGPEETSTQRCHGTDKHRKRGPQTTPLPRQVEESRRHHDT